MPPKSWDTSAWLSTISESVGLLNKDDLQRKPLPATEALIGYLYFVAFKYGPLPRLGYSFWAEDVYEQIDEALVKIRKDLSLADKNMTFFVAHAKIDEKHIDQVTDCIERFVKTPAEQAAVEQVARTTIFLTGQMLGTGCRIAFEISAASFCGVAPNRN